MNIVLPCAPTLSAARLALVLAGGTLLATSCSTTPTYGPDGNVFVQPRYGYGSANQGRQTDNMGRPIAPGQGRNSTKTGNDRKTPDIKRDPGDTTVDITAPESKEKKDPATDTTAGTDTPSGTDAAPKDKPADTSDAKPAVPREDLQYGVPIVGKKGFVYSPFATDKGEVDVEGIPAGTKVKCPYTGKTFRVP